MKTSEKLVGKRLFINSATDQTTVSLFLDDQKVAEEIIESRSELSEKLLVTIDQLIKKHNFQLESVSVFSGPGSYTGLRIGITTANFLAQSLNIPIYETDPEGAIISKKDYVLPVYLHDAHITKPKSRL